MTCQSGIGVRCTFCTGTCMWVQSCVRAAQKPCAAREHRTKFISVVLFSSASQSGNVTAKQTILCDLSSRHVQPLISSSEKSPARVAVEYLKPCIPCSHTAVGFWGVTICCQLGHCLVQQPGACKGVASDAEGNCSRSGKQEQHTIFHLLHGTQSNVLFSLRESPHVA